MKRLTYVAIAALLIAGCDKKESHVAADYAPQAMDEEAEVAASPAVEMKKESRSRPKAKRKPSLELMRGDGASGMAIAEEEPPPMPDPVANNEKYEDAGVNDWTDTDKDNLSTFAIDVDTGAYTNSRRQINQGSLPAPASVRVEEFVNYFKYDYPDPEKTFAVYFEAAPSPFATGQNRYLARVGVQGKRIEAKKRQPAHLTFLVDVSGSMSSPDKLPLAVKALKVLVNNLQPNDTVSLVTYAGNTAKVLDPTKATNRGAIFEALDSLGAGGGTGMEDGMKTAYDLAIRQKKSGGTSRVIVLSDGDANIGRADHNSILQQIEAYVKEGVTMTTIGLGSGNYNEKMMEQLANKGNGNYFYIDSLAEARKVFGEQVDGTLQVIAKDVKLQVEFDPKKVKRYRLIGYENRDIADRDFRNDAVDAGELGAGHTVTALYELELKGAPEEGLGVVRVRHKKPDAIKAVEDAFPFGAANFKKKVNDGSADFQFAASVATFAEILRGSPHTKSVNFDWVLEIAQPAAQNREDRLAFIELVKKAKALK